MFYQSKYVEVLIEGLIMDGCMSLTSTPKCVVSLHWAITRVQPEWSPYSETAHNIDIRIDSASTKLPFTMMKWNSMYVVQNIWN